MHQRGLLLGYQIEASQNGFMVNPWVDPKLVHRYLLYWDLIEWPVDPFMQIIRGLGQFWVPGFPEKYDEALDAASKANPQVPRDELSRQFAQAYKDSVTSTPPELRMLEREGVFVQSEVQATRADSKIVDYPRLYQEARITLFQKRTTSTERVWSIAQSVDERLLATSNTQETNAIEVELYNCLPVPAEDVSTEDILDFKRRRSAELLQLRSALDSLYAGLLREPIAPQAKVRTMETLAATIGTVDRVMRESTLAARRETFRGVLNTVLDSVGFAGGIAAGAVLYDVPLPTATLLGAASALVKLVLTQVRKPIGIPEHIVDYAYIHHARRELRASAAGLRPV